MSRSPKPFFLTTGILGGLFSFIQAADLAGETLSRHQDAGFVQGLTNAEDLVWFHGTQWIAASQINLDIGNPPTNFRFSPVLVLNTATRALDTLYPRASSTVDWDRKTYPDCSIPPENLSPTGLNVRPTKPGRFRLYVNNLQRQSVEVVDVALQGDQFQTTWRGCVRAPKELKVWPNSVVPLPDGGIVMSGYNVAIWRPHQGWKKLAGFNAPGPGERAEKGAYPNGRANGVELSADGQRIYVADIYKKEVLVFPVSTDAKAQRISLTFLPDNLRWGDDGGLYTAGPLPGDHNAGKHKDCFKRKVCSTPFAIARIDPITGAAKEVYRSGSDGIDGVFGGATTALQLGSHLWLGTVHGDRIARVPLKKPTA